MIYGYARVSTLLQNTDRQEEDLLKYGIDKKNLYIDKVSGKTFKREKYIKLFNKIKKGDLIVIKSLDRLGRNYEMIIEEWRKITVGKQADILILDMPILDTRDHGNGLISKFISDIVLQILSFVAENERINISQRTKEGLKIAKAKGKKIGRPRKCLPDNYKEIIKLYKNKDLSLIQTCELLQVSKGTLYNILKDSFDY